MGIDSREDAEIKVTLQDKLRKYQTWKEAQDRGEPAPFHTDLKQRQSMAYLEAALEQAQKGNYGICIDCGEEIPAKRLEAVIGAIRCASCQTEFETTLKNRGRLR